MRLVLSSSISVCGQRHGQRPEVGHGVAAPGAPALAPGRQGRPVVGQPERGGGPADAEVGGQEGVGVAQGPHGDVLGRPGADARECDEGAADLSRVGTRVEHEVTAGDRLGQGGRVPVADPAGMANAPGSRRARSASASGLGKSRVTVPCGVTSEAPAAATRRPATVRAPATETCWPITARTASSKPSTVPATRRPGWRATAGARSGSAPRASATATGSASRSRSCRQRATAVDRSRRSVRASSHSTEAPPPVPVPPVSVARRATTPGPCGSRRLRR